MAAKKPGRPRKPKPFPMGTHTASLRSIAALKQQLTEELPGYSPVLIDAITQVACRLVPAKDLRSSDTWKMNRRGNRPHFDVHILMRDIAIELGAVKGTRPLQELAPIRGSYDEQIAAGRREPCDADRITRVILKMAGMPHSGSLRQQAAAARKLLQYFSRFFMPRRDGG